MDQKAKVLDIAMNLNRIGEWAMDGYEQKRERIQVFLDNTDVYIRSLNKSEFSDKFKKTFDKFLDVYKKFKENVVNDPDYWGEQLMTWGNILTHRAKLI